jgi:hypothetical protein
MLYITCLNPIANINTQPHCCNKYQHILFLGSRPVESSEPGSESYTYFVLDHDYLH